MNSFVQLLKKKKCVATFNLRTWLGRGHTRRGGLMDFPGQGYTQMHEAIAVFSSWQNGKLDVLKISHYKTSKYSS